MEIVLNAQDGTAEVETTEGSGLSVIIYEGEEDDNGCQSYLNITTNDDGDVRIR